MLKVAVMLGSLNRGGTETLLLDVFNHAKDSGIQFIGIHRKHGSLFHDFKNSGVPLFYLGIRRVFDLGYFFRLRKLLLQQSVSIVHAQQPIDALLAWLALPGTGIKVILTLHGYDFEKSCISRLINRFILKRTEVNLFVSDTQNRYYLTRYHLADSGKQQVVYNGVSFDKLKSITNNSIRKEFSIPIDTLLFCSIGNFVPGRDQLTICHFLALLKERNKNFRMIFAGAQTRQNPELFDQCVSFCNDNNLNGNVFFPGSRTDVPDILAQSDAFIYASDHDTFGIAVIEAMAAGLPVFVNDWEVMKEITGDGEHAVVYKTKNEQDLLEKFLPYVSNPEAFVEKAKLASTWVREKYDIKTHLRALSEIYTRLVQEKR